MIMSPIINEAVKLKEKKLSYTDMFLIAAKFNKVLMILVPIRLVMV